MITFNFQISPALVLLDSAAIVWTNAVASQNSSVLYTTLSSTYSNGVISHTFLFNQNIQNSYVNFNLNPQHLQSPTYLNYTASSTLKVLVVPANNIPAVYLPDASCKNIAATNNFAIAEASISYLGLLLSVFSCKIIGLEMFGVLQLSYFALSNYDYVPSTLLGLLQRKEVNGLNIATSASPTPFIPSRVSSNGYTSSDFLANFNLMLLITSLIVIVGGVIYMVTYLMNKESIDE